MNGGEASRPPLLSPRALGRATLARQLLLEPSDLTPEAAIRHLVGLQAQSPLMWYVGLWTRLRSFDPAVAAQLLADRTLVRTVLMRSTLHVVTAADCVALQPVMQAVNAHTFASSWSRLLAGVDIDRLVARGRELFDTGPLTFQELFEQLGDEWSGIDPSALSQAMRLLLPLIQVPPRGLWGQTGPIAHTTAEAWLGRPLGPAVTARELIVRYLGAFGPATAQDIEVWSGLYGLGAVVERLRPELVVFRDVQGAEVFDLPDAPRPDPATPAPVRFLYDADNVLFAYADRSRFLRDEHAKQMPNAVGAFVYGSVLVDGSVKAIWRVIGEGAEASMRIEPFAQISSEDMEVLAAEGRRLLALLEPATEGLVYLGPLRWG